MKILAACILLAACAATPAAHCESSIPKKIEAQVRRLTEKSECVCQLTTDHFAETTVSTTSISFRVESPKEYFGKVITLRLREAPAVVDAFEDVLSHDRFVLKLRRNDLLGIDEEEVVWTDGSVHKQQPAPYSFREILVRVLDHNSKQSANQAPEPTPTAVTPPAGQEARQP